MNEEQIDETYRKVVGASYKDYEEARAKAKKVCDMAIDKAGKVRDEQLANLNEEE